MEAMLLDRPSPAVAPVTVAVGHNSALVSAGLAATLLRMPGCSFRLQQISPANSSVYPPPAEVIFGDSALLRRLQETPTGESRAGSPRKPKFVLVTTGYEPTAHASKAAGEIDDCVSIECPEEELFATVQRLIGAFQPARMRGGLAPGALRRVHEHIERHCSEKISTDDLAEVAGLSPGHFNRAFRQSTGASPHQYVTQRRVAMATELLEKTCRALADIALEVGFADQSHFSRTYAAVTGETPSACRRRHR